MGIEAVLVSEIVKMAVEKRLDIPEFQRDFVWPAEKVKFFAESLYRGYPVGSFLLWDNSSYSEAKHADGSQASLWIVDGQQRTTALCILLGMKPYWWGKAESWNDTIKKYNPLVCILPKSTTDYLHFSLSNPIYAKDPTWVSVREILTFDNEEEITGYMHSKAKELATDSISPMEVLSKIQPAIQRIWQIRARPIPLVKTSHEAEDVAEIFSRLNSAGTRVKEADVMLALAAVRNPGWIKSSYSPFTSDMEDRGWQLSPGVYIRTMTGTKLAKARLKDISNDFWNKESIEPTWNTTIKLVVEVVKHLEDSGLHSAELLPSENSLIPLFTLHAKWKRDPEYAFSRSLSWFIRANRDGRYSGAAISTLDEDLKAISNAESQSDAISKLDKELGAPRLFSSEDFLTRYDRAGSKLFRTMLFVMLVNNRAIDWVDKTRIAFDKSGTAIVAGFTPNWHHIFPKSILKPLVAGELISQDQVNCIANITVLNSDTNVRELRDTPPNEYIIDKRLSQSELFNHVIPDKWSNAANSNELCLEYWNLERYMDFLNNRATAIANAANKLIENWSS